MNKRGKWELSPERFLNREELAALLIRADELKVIGEAKRRPQLIRDWMILNSFLFTGLRRFELTELRCSDFKIFGGNSYLIVRAGKGGKTRHVHLPKNYKKNVLWYLRWKAEQGEIVSPESYFLRTERSEKYSPSGIYKRWKKYCPNHRLHDARHTCATALLEATNSLKMCQKMLGHANVSVTSVYADVSVERTLAGMDAMERLVNSLKKPSRSPKSIAPLITAAVSS